MWLKGFSSMILTKSLSVVSSGRAKITGLGVMMSHVVIEWSWIRLWTNSLSRFSSCPDYAPRPVIASSSSRCMSGTKRPVGVMRRVICRENHTSGASPVIITGRKAAVTPAKRLGDDFLEYADRQGESSGEDGLARVSKNVGILRARAGSAHGVRHGVEGQDRGERAVNVCLVPPCARPSRGPSVSRC